MKPAYRKAILLSLLAGVAVLAWFAPEPADQRVSSGAGVTPQKGKAESKAASTGNAQNAAQTNAPIVAALPERAALGKAKQEIFGPQSWLPPPPKAAPPPPPPPPTPPPNPFRFAGRVVQDGQTQIFLTKGDAPLPVKVGEVLDGTYRVDAIGSDSVAMTYLPLNHKENVAIGFAPDAPGAAMGIPRGPLVFAPPALVPPPMIAPPVANPPLIAPGALVPPRDGSASVVPAERAAAAGRARVAWQGPQQVKLGAPFSVALRVTSDQPISGSPLQVRFDPSVLESVEVRPGKLYSADARGFNYRVGMDGSIVVGTANSGSTATGDQELLVLTFKPLKPGATAEVTLASLNLQGQAGRALAHDTLAAFRTTVVR